MPNALEFIVGADSQPFATEMRRMESIAQTQGRNIMARFAQGASLHGGFAGIFRESFTIGREAIEGRGIGRIIGSSTLLLGFIGRLIGAHKEEENAARVAADTYGLLALRKAQLAEASLKVAARMEAEVMANDAATEADVDAAIAARSQALADEQSAMALNQKALAAERAALAQDAEAVAGGGCSGGGLLGFATGGMGGITILTGALAAVATIAGVVYEKFWGVKNVIAGLGPQMAELPDTYIPMMERHLNDAAKAQQAVADAVARTVEEYRSANAEAERQAKVLGEHYEHLQRLNDLKKEGELAQAKTPAERLAIEKKYSDKELDLRKQQHADQLKAMQLHQTSLLKERDQKLAEANSHPVNTKAEDEDIHRKLELQKKAAEAYLKGGGFWKEFKKSTAIQLGGAGSPAKHQAIAAAIAGAEDGGEQKAQGWINEANKFADRMQANDRIRAQNEQLRKDAEKAAADAARIGLATQDKKQEFATAEADAAEEARARLEADAAKPDREHGAYKGEVNQSQRMGFSYLLSANDQHLAVARQSARHLASIDAKIGKNGGGHSGFGETKF